MTSEAPRSGERLDRLAVLAAAVADGTRVDWDAAAGECATDEERRIVARLRSIAALVEVGRRLGEEGPRRWGPLVLLDLVGHGASGDVLSAWDTQLERPVAVKLLRPGGASDDRGAAPALDEARRLARVRHRNVVTVYGAETFDGEPGLWMELLSGRSLAQVVAEDGPLTVRETVRVGINLCAALEAVHAAGLLHRDLSAANVILENDGRVVLTDFGIGCEVATADRTAARGTPLYAAPEVLAGAPPSVASDLYALGVVLFHTVTGGFPVEGDSLDKLRRAHKSGAARRVVDIRQDVPAALADVVERALARDPGRRFASAAELRLALAGTQDGGPQRRRRRRPTWPLILASAAIVALAAWWWSASGPGRPSSTGAARVTVPASSPAASPDLAAALLGVAAAYEAMGRFDEARPVYVRVLALVEERDGPGSEAAARVAERLGWAFRASGSPGEARVYYARALAIVRRLRGAEDPRVAALEQELATLSSGRATPHVPRGGDPFVAPAGTRVGLGDLVRLGLEGAPYSVEARVSRSPAPALTIEVSSPLFFYLLDVTRPDKIELHRRAKQPLSAPAQHTLSLPAQARRLVLIASPAPVAELELDMSRGGSATQDDRDLHVRLSPETCAALRAFSVPREAGPVLGSPAFSGARPLGSAREIVRGVWIRELRLTRPAAEQAPCGVH